MPFPSWGSCDNVLSHYLCGVFAEIRWTPQGSLVGARIFCSNQKVASWCCQALGSASDATKVTRRFLLCNLLAEKRDSWDPSAILWPHQRVRRVFLLEKLGLTSVLSSEYPEKRKSKCTFRKFIPSSQHHYYYIHHCEQLLIGVWSIGTTPRKGSA